jgi:hypothetical protein
MQVVIHCADCGFFVATCPKQLPILTTFCYVRKHQQVQADKQLLCLPWLHSDQLMQLVPKGRLSIRLMTQRDKNPEGYAVMSYKPFLSCYTWRCCLATRGLLRLLCRAWRYVTCLCCKEVRHMKLCKRVTSFTVQRPSLEFMTHLCLLRA